MEAVNKWALVALTVMVGGWLLVQTTIWHYSAAITINKNTSRLGQLERAVTTLHPNPNTPAVRPSTPPG